MLHRQELDNQNPSGTMQECTKFFSKYKPASGYHALGILSSSPSSAWENVDLLTPLHEACQGTLPLKIKMETTSAVGLAQDALNGGAIFGGSNKALMQGALVGAIGTAIVFLMASKKK